ncbi:MAG: hypothetical protein ACP6IP_00365 [Candidatus Njordarchaeia archaeon]
MPDPIKIAYIDFKKEDGAYRKLNEKLEEFGFKLEYLPPEDVLKKLKKEIYIATIISPKSAYGLLPEEFDVFKNYVLNGGRYLLLFGMDTKGIFNDSLKMLLDIIGAFPRYILLDNEDTITIKEIKKHQITEGIKLINLVDGLSFINSPESMILAKTGNENVVAGVPVLVAGSRGAGKFVLFGSQKNFEEDYLEEEENLQLLLNILCWLTDMKPCPKIIREIPSEKEKEEEKPAEEETKVEEVEEKEEREEMGEMTLEEIEEISLEDETKQSEIEEKGKENKGTVQYKEMNQENNLSSSIITDLIRKYETLRDEVDSLRGTFPSRDLSLIDQKIGELSNILEKNLKNQMLIIDYLKAIREEISNLEIDLLEALRDDINAISQLLKKIDKIETNIEKKIEKISNRLKNK